MCGSMRKFAGKSCRPMDASRWSRVRVLYVEAEALAGDARKAFLDQACAGDAILRAEIEALFKSQSETRVEADCGAPTIPGDSGGKELLSAGTRLGPWRIERLAGRGGMGEVYAAQRADGTFEL